MKKLALLSVVALFALGACSSKAPRKSKCRCAKVECGNQGSAGINIVKQKSNKGSAGITIKKK